MSQNIIGKTFVFLRPVEMVRPDVYRCKCTECGRDHVLRSRATLQNAARRGGDNSCCRTNKDSRAHALKKTEFTAEDLHLRAALNTPEPKLPPRLDVERNRERYVRLKLSARRINSELRSFSDYICSRCNLAPECENAFGKGNTKTKCVKGVK